MREDLLAKIAAEKDVTNVIILTHNIDFVFLQAVALSTLKKCGNPRVTIFADAHCAAESYASQAPLLEGLGVRYRVVPVAMSPGFRFHPKAVLLSGEQKATLFVGSGNLTFGGWKDNAEAWTRFDSGDEPSAFAEFRHYLHEVLRVVPLGDSISAELSEAFDATNRHWVLPLSESSPMALLGRVGKGASLVAKLALVQGTSGADELVVCSPYFDLQGNALGALIDSTLPLVTSVLCQPSGSTLTPRAMKANMARATFKHVSFERTNKSGVARHAFVHAKFYGFVTGDRTTILVGSANCSIAAMTIAGQQGNAELLAIRRVPTAEFASEWLGEFAAIDRPISLPDERAQIDDPQLPDLRLLAARYEGNVLLVAYRPIHAQINSCLLDGLRVPFYVVEPGVLTAACASSPRTVNLEGIVGAGHLTSNALWVDVEQELGRLARGRSLADNIRRRVQEGTWGASSWSEIMAVFCSHLSYTPDISGVPRGAPVDEAKPGTLKQLSYADVFSENYSVPDLQNISFADTSQIGREQSLQQLLLRWFGAIREEVQGEIADPTPLPEDDEDVVDRPEIIKPTAKVQSPSSEAERRRVQKILRQAQETMSALEYLSARPPELLAADLKVAAVLLRAALHEGWIDTTEYFQFTHCIWTSLFLSGSPQPEMGWLEYRLATTEERSAFLSAMQSPSLAAALLGWVLAAPLETTAESTRFQLAAAVAVARLPWLWDGGDTQAVAVELKTMLSLTGKGVDHSLVQTRWMQILRLGHALLGLERSARTVPPTELRLKVACADVHAGELLWQPGVGYCISTQTAMRNGEYVRLLKLQGDLGVREFQGSYIIPVRALIDHSTLPISDSFSTQHRSAVAELLDLLAPEPMTQFPSQSGARLAL